jgi:Heterokaryon incompatibility protein (HET)
MAIKWYRKCHAEHINCGKPFQHTGFVPSRLIELGFDHQSTWRLVMAEDLVPQLPEAVEYVTLSHCWGKSSFLTLKSTNLSSLRLGLPVDELPQTFQDAIYVASRLSCRFLWVDSLCILQDSLEDWRKESSRMSDIYSNAVCSIAATASSDPHQGLFRDRDPVLVASCRIQASWVDGKSRLLGIKETDPQKNQVLRAPLNRRAWVLQERLLSKRLLQFGNEQVFWQCLQLDACESQPGGIFNFFGVDHSFKDYSQFPRHNFFRLAKSDLGLCESLLGDRDYYISLWQYIVIHYTMAHLTKRNDKLIALAGLVDVLGTLYKDKYLAGLWLTHLPAMLLWHRTTGSKDQPIYEDSDKQRSQRAPSWSWASLDGPIIFAGWHIGQKPKSYATLLTAEVNEHWNSVQGSAFEGFVRLDTLILQSHYPNPTIMDIHGRVLSPPFFLKIVEDTPVGKSSLSVYWAFIYVSISQELGSRRKDYCIHGLVLLPKNGEKDQFTRLGFFRLHGSVEGVHKEEVENLSYYSNVIKGCERRVIEIY